MAETSSSQITGDDIISELIRNVDAGRFKVGHTVLLPCRFNVYLHDHDFALVEPIAQVVRREAKDALREYLERLNKVRPQQGLLQKLRPAAVESRREYKILEKDWSIDFHRGEEDRLRHGEIEIYSDLGSEKKAEFGAGAKTTFVTRHPADGAFTRNATDDSEFPGRPFAIVRYTDQLGEKVFAMTRDEIVIGRGGKAVWVDVKVDGPNDISREHCRIRRDAGTGRFFIKDLSHYFSVFNISGGTAAISTTFATRCFPCRAM
ncbi:MAG TPA: FHA domain-containing protein [Terracidiphilus sp.]